MSRDPTPEDHERAQQRWLEEPREWREDRRRRGLVMLYEGTPRGHVRGSPRAGYVKSTRHSLHIAHLSPLSRADLVDELRRVADEIEEMGR